MKIIAIIAFLATAVPVGAETFSVVTNREATAETEHEKCTHQLSDLMAETRDLEAQIRELSGSIDRVGLSVRGPEGEARKAVRTAGLEVTSRFIGLIDATANACEIIRKKP